MTTPVREKKGVAGMEERREVVCLISIDSYLQILQYVHPVPKILVFSAFDHLKTSLESPARTHNSVSSTQSCLL